MISIKRFLDRSDVPPPESGLRRAVSVLLQAIELHAVQGDERDYECFRSEMRVITQGLSEATPAAQLLGIVAAVTAALRHYGDRTNRYIRARGAEYKRIISTLAQVISDLTHHSEASITRLHDIETQLAAASVVDDLREVRVRLGHCVEALRAEAANQRNAGLDLATRLRQEIKPSEELLGAGITDVDSVTGIPAHMSAEAALIQASQRAPGFYAVVIVANRVQAINSRLGFAVGDLVIRKVHDQIRASFTAEQRVFRWRGPSFVVVLHGSKGIEDLRREIASSACARSEDLLVEVGSRSALIPISASWSVFPVVEPHTNVIRDIDRFVAMQVPLDY